MNESLQKFIEHARDKGMDHSTIRTILLSSGWKEKDIAEAMTKEALEMPVPLPTDSGGAREAFFHLLTFASLYTTLISLLVLLFAYINRLLPDPAMYDYYSADAGLSSIRWSMAAVIVAFPILVWLSRLLLREMAEHPERSVSGIRRWLTYLTLFVAATALMGDIITLIYSLLQGELTLRFILKVLVVFAVAGGTFWYYLQSLRLEPGKKKSKALHRSFSTGTAIVVVAVLVWGAMIVGSPGSQRARNFDDRRIEDFQVIQSEILNYVYQGRPYDSSPVNPVPATLQDVADNAVYQKVDVLDPETSEPYSYEKLSATEYRLCATFNTPRDDRYSVSWNHPEGFYCFDLDVTELSR